MRVSLEEVGTDVLASDKKAVAIVDSVSDASTWSPPQEWLERFIAEYSGQHGGETLPAGSDPERVAAAIFTMNEEDSIKVLRAAVENHQSDYTIDRTFLSHIAELAEGNQACDMEYGEWAYMMSKTAGLFQNWSPYAEVRAVTVPYDDPEEPCESIRAYVLGLFWVCACTAINTCKSFVVALTYCCGAEVNNSRSL